MDKNKKNDGALEPLEPLINMSTGEMDIAISDDFVMDDSGRVKHRIAKDVFLDIDSGHLEIIEPLFNEDKSKK